MTIRCFSFSFGDGMWKFREVCCAISGIYMFTGVLYGYDNPIDQKRKAEHYERVQKLAKAFSELNKSIVCRDLLG